MSAEHTPGPWVIERDGVQLYARVDSYSLYGPKRQLIAATMVALTGDDDAPISDATDLANVHVLAAAPALLAACEHLAAVLEHWDAPDAPSRDDMLRELRAAVGKAQGAPS